MSHLAPLTPAAGPENELGIDLPAPYLLLVVRLQLLNGSECQLSVHSRRSSHRPRLQTMLILEMIVERVAAELGMRQEAVTQLNMYCQGDRHTSGQLLEGLQVSLACVP